MSKKAVILFSGGLDSTTCLAIAKSQGFDCYTLSFDYGQKHNIEVENAKRIAKTFAVKEHKILKIPLNEWGGSAITDNKISIPDFKDKKHNEIPNTYVPARNTIFLSIALGWAEVIKAFDIFMGANSMDYSGYPDCRPEYFHAFQVLADIATKAGVEGKNFTIHAPLLQLSKAQIIQMGTKLGIDYGMTLSCYRLNAEGHACGRCDSCVYRKKGFREAQVNDPTRYYS